MTIFRPADIMLPQNTEYTKWSVIACDQHTSELGYWQKTAAEVGDAPSALNIIFPEVYLGRDDARRIEKINKTMRDYIDGGLFRTLPNTFIYVERTLSTGKIRHSVIGTIDLEKYDFLVDDKPAVRATEDVVYERIPPRVRIRENAPLEISHVMILTDDPEKKIVEGAKNLVSDFDIVYDFELMQGGGHIRGYAMCDASRDIFIQNVYNMEQEKLAGDGLVYAVGDGNHSLATAKECWERTKRGLSDEEMENHPARFALVELVNIHDDAIEFEPIHRVLFGAKKSDVIDAFRRYYPKSGKKPNDGHHIKYIAGSETGDLYVKSPKAMLDVGTLQDFLEDYMKKHNVRVDYIHGEEAVRKNASKYMNIGFILPPMQKSDLFRIVAKGERLPKKTFSMGESSDKRYYLEARLITE